MIKNQKLVISYSIIIGVSLIFLDAYELFNIPLTWIGQAFLLLLALTEFKKFKDFFTGRIFIAGCVLLLVPQIFVLINSTYSESTLIYIALRYFNIFSFLIVLLFSMNYSNQNYFDNDKVIEKLKIFCFAYSLVVIYIFLAQIYDLYEPFRNRDNTNIFGDSGQSIFWLSQPHRAMGTFREPSFLITFFYPLVLLVTKFLKKTNILFCIATGVALGLTRSDYVRFFSLIVFIFIIFSYYSEKKVNFNFIVLLLSILFFSTFGVLECNLNPNSIECGDYLEDVESINRSGKLQIKSNTAASVVDIGTERINVVTYFYTSFNNLNPNGIGGVNQSYQYFETIDINNEMYLTNRTLPDYLLTRYSTKNFGTGSYSILRYEINVQNILVFYTKGFGVIFLVLLFFMFLEFITLNKLSVNTVNFLMIILFFTISPIEEVNAYYGLMIGLSYNLLIKGDKYEEI